jgi:predicted DsbA family dithiol-disulfide isomerase
MTSPSSTSTESSATPRMTIDVFSDVVCPWCFIGTQRLEQVLAARNVDADVRYRTFLLDPTTPEEGRNVPEMLRKKYGADPAKMWARVEGEARKSNIELDLSKQPMMYPTIRAHTLLRHALPLGTQRALAKALFQAYFVDAKNIADPAVLVELATAHGFTKERATELLADETELAITRRSKRCRASWALPVPRSSSSTRSSRCRARSRRTCSARFSTRSRRRRSERLADEFVSNY